MKSRAWRPVLAALLMGLAPGAVGAQVDVRLAAVPPATDSLASEVRADAGSDAAAAASSAGPADDQVSPEWDDGSLGLAIGETMLANVTTWLAMEYVLQWKDLTRASPATWGTNLTGGPTWDDNKFQINWWSHPWGGSNYFSAGRSNGLNFEKSFLLTVLGSLLWECCGESHRASLSDLVTTTLGGAALGEVFYRWGSQAYANGNVLLRTGAGLLGPPRALTRLALKRPKQAPAERPWALPTISNLSITTGFNSSYLSLRSPSGPRLPVKLERPGAFLEFGYSYGDPAELKTGSRPYHHFVVSGEANAWGERHWLTRLHIRGSLWPLRAESDGWHDLVTFYQGFDYLNVGPPQPKDELDQGLVEFGMQSLGIVSAFQNSLWGMTGTASFEGHVGFGGIYSEFAFRGEIEEGDRERFREYDFTLGGGFGASADVDFWNAVRLHGFARIDRLAVLHGSNIDDYDSSHAVAQYGMNIEAPRLLNAFFNPVFRILFPNFENHFGLGIDYKKHTRSSWFENPEFDAFPRVDYDQFRAYLLFNTSVEPGRLFPF